MEADDGPQEGSSEERALNLTAEEWPCWASPESPCVRPQSVKEVDCVKPIPLTVKVPAVPSVCIHTHTHTHTLGKSDL